MAYMAKIQTFDGKTIRICCSDPAQEPNAGIVIMHEAFGMNDHIRDICDRYARLGYLIVSPALYDRVEFGLEVPGYGELDLEKALELRKAANWDHSVNDMQVAIDLAREAGPVGVVGYCWGGSLAWLAGTRCNVDSVVSYYGGQITKFINEIPKCPVMAHFALNDVHVPKDSAEKVKEYHPGVKVYTYEANHGFNCDQRSDYDIFSAKLAYSRTVTFLAETLVDSND